jgi:hypothetical protein
MAQIGGNNMNIRTSVEGKRGCGHRKEGGLYLVCEGEGRFCGALPIELSVCPTCHHGVKPSRGWTWIDLRALRAAKPCVQSIGPNYCDKCSMNYIGMVGLLWVGEKYYASPREFSKEAQAMGISRRISAVPRDFEVGRDWVALEGKDGQIEMMQEFKPGIFHVFLPSRIEYVIRPTDSKEKLESMEKRGISLVKVIKKEEEKAA